MLAIQPQMSDLRRIPAVGTIGLVVHVADLLGIAGMFLVLAGVAVDAARPQLRQRAVRNGGFDGHAHR